jgi:hypothetical protein
MTATSWNAFLVNWLFWSGTAIGAVVFAALLELTNARWSDHVRSIAERFFSFLLLSLAAYVALVVHAPRLYGRGLVALSIVYAAAFWFHHASRRPDGWRTRATIVLLMVYVAGFSILANDEIMSLDPDWVSTLFPAYVFTTNVYGAIAMVAAVILVSELAGRVTLDERQRRDLGVVLVGFALLWMYLVWSQYLVIWYGNLPDEAGYIVRRMTGRWREVVWALIGLRFALPVVVLISRTGRRRIPFTCVAVACVVGFWMEYLLMIAPASTGLRPSSTVGMTAAFALAFVLATIRRAARSSTALTYSDSSPLR